jgi:tripeptide aminopeptidase
MTPRTPFDASLQERMVRYARIDSQADERSSSAPSTDAQWAVLRELESELKQIGAQDVRVLDEGFVLATVPSTLPAGATAPVVAFLAHVDTAPQFNATGVKPIVHPAWEGNAIHLPDDPSQVLDPSRDDYLRSKVGDDLITASGTTLLGADDKAGVAIVVTLAEHLLASPEIPHGAIRLCFTTDEEIGTGIRRLKLDELGADVAYTLDGSMLGQLTYESFSADKAEVEITGVSIHPGTATGVMVDALHLGAKILSLLPQHTRTPDTTSGRGGFIHATTMYGDASHVKLGFILRDFELDGLESHGELLRLACQAVQASEPRARVECTITKQYRNMRYWLENDMRPVEFAVKAMQRAGVEPLFEAIRGGTDGSQLTEAGLPTPNIFCGSMNVHGPLEWVSVQDMAAAVNVCTELARLWAEAGE